MVWSEQGIVYFVFGGMTVCFVVSLIILVRIEKAVVELRAAIERLIVVDTVRKP